MDIAHEIFQAREYQVAFRTPIAPGMDHVEYVDEDEFKKIDADLTAFCKAQGVEPYIAVGKHYNRDEFGRYLIRKAAN